MRGPMVSFCLTLSSSRLFRILNTRGERHGLPARSPGAAGEPCCLFFAFQSRRCRRRAGERQLVCGAPGERCWHKRGPAWAGWGPGWLEGSSCLLPATKSFWGAGEGGPVLLLGQERSVGLHNGAQDAARHCRRLI